MNKSHETKIIIKNQAGSYNSMRRMEPSFSQKCEDGPTLEITYQWKTPPYQLALHRGASNNLLPTQKVITS
jgi:hypothetical protein